MDRVTVIARADSRPSLGAISVPTLVLVGDRDPATPQDHLVSRALVEWLQDGSAIEGRGSASEVARAVEN